MSWRFAMAGVAMAALAACGTDSPEMMATPGQSGAMGRNAEMGSAMSGRGMESVGEPMTGKWPGAKEPPPPPKTPAQIAEAYTTCLGHLAANALDKLAGCYSGSAVFTLAGAAVPPPSLVGATSIVAQLAAERVGHPDGKSELQLAIASGRDVVAVVLETGTHSGVVAAGPESKSGGFDVPLRDAPATNKPYGFLSANVVTFDDSGRIDQETRFFDAATQLGQLGIAKAPARPIAERWPPPAGGKRVLLSRGDDGERTNLRVHGQFIEALNRHDAAAAGLLIADDAAWSELAQPTDWDKKAYLAHLAQQWRSFSDLRTGMLKVWTAGDLVIAVESFAGKNDGDLPGPKGGGPIPRTMATVNQPRLTVYRFVNGKIARAWTFHQSAGFAAQLVRAPKKR